MKKKLRQFEGVFPYAVATVVYLFIVLPFCLLLSQLSLRNTLLLQYQAEQEWSRMMMQLRDLDTIDELFNTQENLLGIVILDSSGVVLQTEGSMSNTTHLGEVIQLFRDSMEQNGNGGIERTIITDHKSVLLTQQWNRFDYVTGQKLIISAEFSMHSYWDLLQKQKIAFGFGLILCTICYVAALRMIQNHRRYKKKFEDNVHLIQLGDAARTLSHEMKNPLSTIAMESALLRKVGGPELTGDLDIIDEEVFRLTRLVNRVGDFLKNPKGIPEKIAVHQTIRQLMLRFNADIDFLPAGQSDNTDEPPAELFAYFDADRFRSVLENLIKNAIEATAESNSSQPDQAPAPKPAISIETHHKGKELVIEVKDRGQGLPPRKNQIFDPFFTTKIQGTGIGLSITKRFVEVAGGKLSLKDQEEGGVVAKVTLPLYDKS